MEIAVDNLADTGVIQLLEQHLEDMYATSPPESVHALNIDELKEPSVTFWSAKKEGKVVGCIGLKEISAGHGEIKSMRTATTERNQGVASRLLSHVLQVAKDRQYDRVSLETGSMEFFAPARTLYKKYGFQYCEPFGAYQADDNSRFMTLSMQNTVN
ncbi:GNAT family N-acetyltransferase [Vibrio sp. ZSDZ34]|uniref:GNAT family N-acetyltransferase n=1 Tax=Vibrio gelatinilyticus TaxID=2893468 RepID=A0A9X2AYJ1_9VIBR|nr:GNAT family N-acetyltransferase [Vibrio gelatinilyticus]MCJ2376708.1 GNAT family N-acetyltransferase [Vibrio gelatinilyticus]